MIKRDIFLLSLVSVILLAEFVLSLSTVSFFFNTSDGADSESIFTTIVDSSYVAFQIETDRDLTCRYDDDSGLSYFSMTGSFDLNLGTIHKKEFEDLDDGSHVYYVRCVDDQGTETPQFRTTFYTIEPVSAIITLSEDSPLRSGKVRVNVLTSKVVSEPPILTYSLDGTRYDPIPLEGSGKDWEGFLIIEDDAGEKAGSFKFIGEDLEGGTGELITDGGIFLVDTVDPETIVSLEATGYQGLIELEWKIEEESEVDYYNIYRSKSPNVDFSDFYKKEEDDDFADTIVTKGTTYYYRVTAVDEAGNEGGLSVEAFATALRSNNSVSDNGLSIELVGFVDNTLSAIDLLNEDIDRAEDSFKFGNDNKKGLYEELKLERDYSNVRSELSSLKNEVENFKLQNLVHSELTKKLNSAQLKVNAIKQKVPESVIVNEEKSEQYVISESDLGSLALETNPGIIEDERDEIVKVSLEQINNKNINIKTTGKNVEIVYLDGSRKERALIKGEIESDFVVEDNSTLFVSIPNEIARSTSDIEVKNTNYGVVKEDLILSFSSETQNVLFTVLEYSDLDSLKFIRYGFLNEIGEGNARSPITGYFAFPDLSTGKNYIGIFAGIILISLMLGYFFFLKSGRKISESVDPIRERIKEIKMHIDEENYEIATSAYEDLCVVYLSLKESQKKKVYEELQVLHSELIEKGGNRHEI